VPCRPTRSGTRRPGCARLDSVGRQAPLTAEADEGRRPLPDTLEGSPLTYLQAVVLGLVQGLGEFLPISSSAHLILVPYLLGWEEHGLAFDIALHLGTLAAVTVYFWRDLLDLAIEGLTKGTRTPMGRIGWGIVIGTVPAVISGYLLEERVETAIRHNPVSIAILLLVMGFVLYLADRRGKKWRSLEDVTMMDVFWMGVGQAFAVIPGFSRSGTTITAGLMLGLERETAARISFLLGWPVILGAGILKLKELMAGTIAPSFWVGVLVSAVSGYAVIAFLMDYLRRGTFFVFAVYRAALAFLTLLVYFLR
jgi:undecaprenyl-diphosphatase